MEGEEKDGEKGGKETGGKGKGEEGKTKGEGGDIERGRRRAGG